MVVTKQTRRDSLSWDAVCRKHMDFDAIRWLSVLVVDMRGRCRLRVQP